MARRRKSSALTPEMFETTILRKASEDAAHEVMLIREKVFYQLANVELMLQAFLYEIRFGSRAGALMQVNGRAFY